ncbi:RNA-binding protein 44 isoform X2 [Boleophthalmus pectinirostris]|uniref:RNA-binding protein 44 isoform X2 n=1 Tax=Boleophthalmus pectinirostris TaxID=150288 RepID=UPI002430AB21|nr:RNA-binding protein 44 isoform X2 [Boleophthalmus pectinirostris]
MFRSINMMPNMPPQTVCQCSHCPVDQALIASRQACMLNDYPRIHMVPPPAPVPPQLYRVISEAPHLTSADRALFLRNSVFRLIYENIYLALTDSKLLGWYLALSPDDRKIIQDDGGFHQFLKKHPGLELSKHHVYVKNVIPEESRDNFPLYHNRYKGYNEHQSCLHTNYSRPPLQTADPKVQEISKLTWPMAHTSNDHNDKNLEEQLANMSRDMQLEKHIQEVNPQTTTVVLLSSPDLHCSGGSALLQNVGHETSLKENFYSILEADKSIVLCVPNQSPDTSQLLSGDLVSGNEVSIIESIIRKTEDRSTSPMTAVCTCDATVGTEQTMTMSTLSQTEPQQTADKHLNTEVYMLDLDYVTEEYITIKTERDKLLEKMTIQRTTLARVVNDLKTLETDYNKMREKILSGISLQDLKPLSLDKEKTEGSTVAMRITDTEKTSAGSPKQHDDTMDAEPAHISDNNNNSSQESEMLDSSKGNAEVKRAVTCVPMDGSTSQRPDGKLSVSTEAWFDAEEDLSSGRSEVQLKEDEDLAARTMDKPKVVNAGLCVSGLPTNVTENDVRILFQKYRVSEIHISSLKELSVAIVIVETQQSEAAMRELNGLKIKGHTLQVERINPSRSEDQGQSFTCTSKAESSNNLSKNQNQSPASSSLQKKVVCVSPTAQGTFVPQHYGTMGSFDILMSELTQRHPSVSRQRIVDALLELRAKYRGVLSGLPLRTIRDMTSDLLTSSPAPKI